MATTAAPPHPLTPAPRGAVLVVVMVALMVASAVFVSIVRLAAAERGAWRDEVRQAQAAWLAESGLERAAARLRDDPDYRGETWTIPAEVFSAVQPARVIIEVTHPDSSPAVRQIHVEAHFPDDPIHRTIHRRQLALSSATTDH